MGPESAKSSPGQQLTHAEPQPGPLPTEPPTEAVAAAPQPGVEPPVPGPQPDRLSRDISPEPQPGVERPNPRAERAKQEIDYGRRGKGYIFGAFRPATGEALTHPYPSRSTANWADFLGRVEAWIPAEVERVYAIVDDRNVHRAMDVLLFAPAFARWEFVFQPKYAAYLNLIEPWWKVLRSPALKGRRFEGWEEVCRAVEEATASWNKDRHPFVWGRRRRHRPRRRPGIASVPGVRGLAG
jgi:DDE superfamily endonuclease